MHDMLVVGNYCHDKIIRKDGGVSHTLGGSAAYISSIVGPLGVDFEVVSKVGEDFRYIDAVKKKPRIIPGAATTQFIADFTRGDRESQVSAVCEPIYASDLADPSLRAKVALGSGVMAEILPETLQKMTEHSTTTLCDIQALIRALDGNGNVLHVPLAKTPFADLLNRITVLKASQFESQFVDLKAVKEKTTLIITQGARGCIVYEGGREYHVDAFPAAEIDPTGAGDCFMAGLAYGIVRGIPFGECVVLANYCGSQAVSHIGVPKLDPSIYREAGRLSQSVRSSAKNPTSADSE